MLFTIVKPSIKPHYYLNLNLFMMKILECKPYQRIVANHSDIIYSNKHSEFGFRTATDR